MLAVGIVSVHPKTVANPATSAPTTVTLRIAPPASMGTPPRPAIWTSVTEPAGTGPPPELRPSTVEFGPRVSRRRAGGTVTRSEPTGPTGPTGPGLGGAAGTAAGTTATDGDEYRARTDHADRRHPELHRRRGVQSRDEGVGGQRIRR